MESGAVDEERLRSHGITLLGELPQGLIYDIIPEHMSTQAPEIRERIAEGALSTVQWEYGHDLGARCFAVGRALKTHLPWDYRMAFEQAALVTANILAEHFEMPWYSKPEHWLVGGEAIVRSSTRKSISKEQRTAAVTLCRTVERYHGLRDTTFL